MAPLRLRASRIAVQWPGDAVQATGSLGVCYLKEGGGVFPVIGGMISNAVLLNDSPSLERNKQDGTIHCDLRVVDECLFRLAEC